MASTTYYDPFEREPKIFFELTKWMATATAAVHSNYRLDTPVLAYDPDHHYLETYCKVHFGGWGMEQLCILRDRYLLGTGKTVPQIDETSLRELALFFGRPSISVVPIPLPPDDQADNEAPINDTEDSRMEIPVDADMTEGMVQILEALREATEPLSAVEVATKAGLAHDTTRQYLRPNAVLRARGLVEKTARGYVAAARRKV